MDRMSEFYGKQKKPESMPGFLNYATEQNGFAINRELGKTVGRVDLEEKIRSSVLVIYWVTM